MDVGGRLATAVLLIAILTMTSCGGTRDSSGAVDPRPTQEAEEGPSRDRVETIYREQVQPELEYLYPDVPQNERALVRPGQTVRVFELKVVKGASVDYISRGTWHVPLELNGRVVGQFKVERVGGAYESVHVGGNHAPLLDRARALIEEVEPRVDRFRLCSTPYGLALLGMSEKEDVGVFLYAPYRQAGMPEPMRAYGEKQIVEYLE